MGDSHILQFHPFSPSAEGQKNTITLQNAARLYVENKRERAKLISSSLQREVHTSFTRDFMSKATSYNGVTHLG